MASNVSTLFGDGIGVLAVDCNEQSLKDIVGKLESYGYTVTPCSRVSSALDILNKANGSFNLVLTEARMVDMDAFALLEQVKLTFGIPVIMMSAGGGLGLAMECLNAGASFYLQKPLDCAAAATIWQHVSLKRKTFSAATAQILENSGPSSFSAERGERRGTGESPANFKEEVDEDRDNEKDDDVIRRQENTVKQKTGKRVSWTGELHLLFTHAVDKLGINKATPKKILERMRRPELTRSNVASHLQKYRLYLTKSKHGSRKRFYEFSLNRKRSVFESGPKHLTKSHRLQMEVFSEGRLADDRRPVEKEVESQSAKMPYTGLPVNVQGRTTGEMDVPRRSIPWPGINLPAISNILSSNLNEARQHRDFGRRKTYVGLQLQDGIGQIRLAQDTYLEPEPINPAIGGSQDEHVDYMILDQLLQEEVAAGEKKSSMQMDFQSSSPKQSDSMTPSNGWHLSPDKPVEELQARNEVSTNDFVDIVLDNMMGLLLDPQITSDATTSKSLREAKGMNMKDVMIWMLLILWYKLFILRRVAIIMVDG
ncbi:unnamed protein product [Spirodela intermedia]|uniref:Uncharacterized protein n=1 Tax=Spirodela intermedia TaxID=51605 RepID=A0A7I8L507_SPIIN|nr:unnamed protein product [Spirodela intermedia]